jgi:hypothetical protein
MELTCSRCHQTVEEGACFCPACGLPQLVYAPDASAAEGAATQGEEPVRDAGSIHWKPALRLVVALAIPAGILCSALSPAGFLGMLVMALTAAWAVALYMRSQRPAWITMGAGVRIGLVTGVIGGWTAAVVTGGTLYAMRYWMNQGHIFDDFWQNMVSQQMSQQWTAMGVDAQTIALAKSWLLSPEGRAGWVLCAIVFLVVMLLIFAAAGGALGARFLGRRRRPQN